MNGAIVIAILIVAFGIFLMSREASIDIAGPLRNWFNRRDADRIAARTTKPATVQRTYWTLHEYKVDARRYQAMGYDTVSEKISEPYVIAPYVAELYENNRGPTRRLTPPRHRVPVARVVYGLHVSGRRGRRAE